MDLSKFKFTKTHEWITLDSNNSAKIGITDHAQKELGDIVFIELPSVGTVVSQGKQFGTIESTKAASELYSPASGEVTEVNNLVSANPQLVNKNPYCEGWMIKIKIKNVKELDSLSSSEI